MKSVKRATLYQAILSVVLGVIALTVVAPLLLILSISFSSEASIISNGYHFWPREFSIHAYEYIFENGSSILRAFGISVVVTVLGTLLAVFLMSLYSYALSRQDFAFRRFFTFYIFFTMLFSGGLVPGYLVMTKILHLQDTLLALILPLAFNAFFVIVLRTFLQNIPQEIIDSGRIDGAGEWTIFFHLILPIAIPGIATIGLFSAVTYWNDWFQALLYIRNPNLLPLQTFLSKIQQNIELLVQNPEIRFAQNAIMADLPRESSRMAIVVLTLVPILVSYPFFQRFFISGLTVGAIKE